MRTITLEQLKRLKGELERKVEINRGDVWMIDIPEEAKQVFGKNIQVGIRPCVIISGEGNNKHANIINILPISSQIQKVYPQHTKINTYEDIKACGLKEESIVLGEQYLTLGKERLIKKLGKAPKRLMQDIDKKQEVQQGLNNKSNFNWKEAFTTVKMLLKVRDTDAEVCYFLYKQLQQYCGKFDIDANIVLEKYKQYHLTEKQQQRTNIYGTQYKINRKVKKNIGHLAMQNCYAQA